MTAFMTEGGDVTFNHHRKDILRQLELPCGGCIGCRLERSRQWATRCMHEQQMHERSSYLTLTYNDEHLPEDGSLRHSDFQRFMKRLRKAAWQGKAGMVAPAKVRELDGRGNSCLRQRIAYYMGGEYGEDIGRRPHYHVCLFGIDFDDKLKIGKRGKHWLYESQALNELWGMGYASVGALTWESAAYVARYVMKKVTGHQAYMHYEVMNTTTGELVQLKPEYNAMSKRPAIGHDWLLKYEKDVYPHGKTVMNGVQINAPRYYDKLYEKLDAETFQNETQWQRQKEGRKHAHEQTRERLTAREKVKTAQISRLKRTFQEN